ncbi:MAG: AsmA family protein [Pseudomonadales bacterium]|nr:AsmA family protein [Pseudomonadales bacterium]
MKRSSALLIVAPMALVVIALLLLPLLLDKARVLELATAMLREQTGATLVVGGDIGLRLVPRTGVSLEDVSLALPGEDEPTARVRSLRLGLQLVPLLSGKVAIDRLDLEGLDYRVAAGDQADRVDTSVLSDAQLDEYYAQRRRDKAASSNAAGALAIPLALNVATLNVTDSRLRLENAGGGDPTIIELQRFEASDLNLDARPMRLAATVILPREQLQLDMEATLRLDPAQQSVSIEQFALEASGATAQPIRLRASGTADLNRQTADLELSVASGDVRGEGSLVYAALESPAIDADMHFNRFDPAIFALAGPEATSAAGDSPAGGDDPLPLAALRDIDTRATLAIDEALLAGHQLQSLQIQLRALEGVVEVKSLTGEVYGGQLAARATFNGRHNTATLETRGEVRDLDIAAALAGAGTKPLATGQASLDWELQGAGRTRNQLVQALTGPITLQTSQVVLRDIGVEQLLCEAVALTNQETLSASFAADTRFQALEANVQLAAGTATLRALRADLDHIKLTGSGAYTLLDGNFDTTFKARLSPELESLDRACRVSKRLTAIDWPLDCSGNIDGEPGKWCKVDTAAIVKDLSVNEAQRKIEKKAGKLLDKLFN